LALRLRTVLLVLLLVLTGCSMTPERLLKSVEKKSSRLKGYYAELDAVVYSTEGEQKYTVRQWVDLPSRWRIEVDFASEQQVFICDGEQVWVYQPGLKEYYRFAANRAGEVPPPFLLLSYLEEILKTQSLKLHGVEKKGRFNCYLVSHDGPGSGETTSIYLERKHLFPIFVETHYDKKLINRLSCTHLVLNPATEAELFKFEAPADAEVSAHCLTMPLSLEEARNEWPLPLFVPRYLPPGARLFSVTRSVDEEREQLILIYDGVKGFVLVQKETTNNPVHKAPGMQEVRIGGSTGLFQRNRLDDLNTLWWSNETNDFVLSGAIPIEEMVKIAESLEAE
jgi:outer membrane lipoprotein-sorting protein